MKFFLGQRVRKVWSYRSDGTGGVGRTGTYIGPIQVSDPRFDCQIKCDSAWIASSGKVRSDSDPATCISAQWEPIVPSGHQPAEESLEELLPFLKEQKVSA